MADELLGRLHLAAALRWAAREGWHETVANHFSLRVPGGILINPNGVHFALVRARDLLLLDPDDPGVMGRPGAPDPTAWALHGAIHRRHAHAACALHLHPPFATVLACLADPTMPPIDQNGAGFFNRVAVDPGYGGFALGDEAERVAGHLADPLKRVLLMAHHGVMVVGSSVADALTRLAYFERAAATYVRALSTGRPLAVLPDEVAERTARDWDAFDGFADRFMAEILRLLDRDEPDFRL